MGTARAYCGSLHHLEWKLLSSTFSSFVVAAWLCLHPHQHQHQQQTLQQVELRASRSRSRRCIRRPLPMRHPHHPAHWTARGRVPTSAISAPGTRNVHRCSQMIELSGTHTHTRSNGCCLSDAPTGAAAGPRSTRGADSQSRRNHEIINHQDAKRLVVCVWSVPVMCWDVEMLRC
jgi:hypothetical protein